MLITASLVYAWTEFVDMLDVPPATYWAVIDLSRGTLPKTKKQPR